MTMRGILVHVDEHQALPSVLTCALLAARRFDSQIDGLHARPGAPRIIPVAPEGAFIPASEIVEDLERADRDLDRQLRERYDAFMREHGVPAAGSVLPGAEVAASWRDEAIGGYEVLGSLGRAYDLIVRRPPAARRGGALDERARDRPVRERPPDPDRAADAAGQARRRRGDRLERQHRDRAHDRAGHAVPGGGREPSWC